MYETVERNEKRSEHKRDKTPEFRKNDCRTPLSLAPIQQMPASARYIRKFAREKGLGEIPDDFAEAMKDLINATVSRGYFSSPSLERLSPLFAQLAGKKRELSDATAFQNYLSAMAGTFRAVREGELDLSPTHKRGADGNEILEQKYQFSGDNIIHRLDGPQQELFYEQIAILQEYCDAKGISNILQGAAINVKNIDTFFHYNAADNGYTEASDQRARDIYINRLRLMTRFVKATGDRELNGAAIKAVYYIRSTGSDPHEGGSHALFLVDRHNPAVMILYKPHSLALEHGIQSPGGVVAKVNETKAELPVMEIQPDLHTEEFVGRTGDYSNPLLSEEAVKEQYWKLGALEAVMSLSGITDLHGENIMFTEKGPISIDGECGGSYGSTGISGGSSPGNISEQGEFTNPSALYIHIGGTKCQVMKDAYMESFTAGKNYMEVVLYRNKAAVLSRLDEKLQGVDSYRMLPFGTDDLAVALERYIKGADGTAQAIAELYYNDAVSYFNSAARAYHREGCIAVINKDIFIETFANALTDGTLPAFTYQQNETDLVGAGAIMLDGRIIGQVKVPNEEIQGKMRNMTANEARHNYIAKASNRADAKVTHFGTLLHKYTEQPENVCMTAAVTGFGQLNALSGTVARKELVATLLSNPPFSIEATSCLCKSEAILNELGMGDSFDKYEERVMKRYLRDLLHENTEKPVDVCMAAATDSLAELRLKRSSTARLMVISKLLSNPPFSLEAMECLRKSRAILDDSRLSFLL